jgi:cyclase
MSRLRLIARIDVKNEFVIKGIHLEGLRKMGDPNEFALRYFNQGIDEIFFMDAVAAYYDRNSLSHIIEKACQDVFVPITVGGGLRTIEDIQTSLNHGADKVAINTQAVRDPNFLNEASRIFGSQCIVASIVAKKIEERKWEVYTDNGREPTGIDAVEWAKQVQEMGVGEIALTSIDADGTKKGFDLALSQAIAEVAKVPLIAGSGAGSAKHCSDLVSKVNVDAVAVGSLLHYQLEDVQGLKIEILKTGRQVRL